MTTVETPRTVEIVPLAAADIGVAARLAARSFNQDPCFVATIPDAAERLQLITPLFETLVRAYHLHGGVLTTRGKLEGVALWLPPGEQVTDEELAAAGIAQAFEPWGAERAGLIGGFFQQFGEVHGRLVSVPHWYILVLATAPARQGQGIGSALLRAVTDRADAEGIPCYLETDVPKNVPFYQRWGFRIGAEEPARGLPGVTLWGMPRDPKPAR